MKNNNRKVQKNNEVIIDNPTDCHGTPLALFQSLNSVFSFSLDVCANASNFKVKRYYSVKENGLIQPWDRKQGSANFGNIPFSDKKPWFRKAEQEANKGAVIVLLTTMDSLTSRAFDSSKPTHLFVTKGRLTFEGSKKVFQQGIVLVIYNGNKVSNIERLNELKSKKNKQIGFLMNLHSFKAEAA